MKRDIFEILSAQGDLTWQIIVENLAVAAIIGIFIYLSYALTHRGTVYSRKFGITLTILTVLTTMIMTVIGNNVSLSLGMVGALSIVRFRTAIKDSRDTAYIFWTVAVGICCGIQDYFVAAVGSAAVFILLLLFGTIKSDTRMLVIVRGKKETEAAIEALVYKMFNRKAILRAKNTTPETVEFIFEITDQMYKKALDATPDITDEYYSLEGISYVNFVLQNDEISS